MTIQFYRFARALCAALILLFTASQTRAELLGYWSADTTNGQGETIVNDLGDPELDGELIEAGYTGDGGGHTGEPGDYAMEFEGFDEDYASIPPLDVTFNEITITAWVNGFPNGAWTGLVTTREIAPSLYLGFHDSTTNLTYVWNDNSNQTWGWDSEVSVEEEEWTFVALTITDEEATVYAGPSGGDLDSNTNEIEHFAQDSFGEWRFAEDGCCGPDRNFAGLIDDVSIWDEALSVEQIMRLHERLETPLTLAGINIDPYAKLDDGSLTDPTARADYIHDVLKTWIGDSNKDGEFNSSDFVAVFTAGEYEDDIDGNSTWATGDWNGDGNFNSSDFVVAFSDGGFEQGPRPAVSNVPEPSGLLLLMGGILAMFSRRRKR